MKNFQNLDPVAVRRELERTQGDLEISPDANGYVLDDNGTAIGYIKVIESSKVKFLWTSQSAAWPTKFDLIAPSGSLPSITVIESYEHDVFPTNTISLDVSKADYRILQGGVVVGYLERSSTGLNWFAVPGKLDSQGYFPAGAMTFESFTDSGSVAVHHLHDQAL